MMTIHLVAAARPNFMKIAPLFHALSKERWADPKIVHTGQHYDLNMSETFFQDLQLPKPHIHLGVGSGTHAEQTGLVMMAYEKCLMESAPDLVIVVGDVNSTIAATLAAVKLGVKVAHLEAGLRSFDRTMPEEINRVVTDALSDILWTPSPDGDENLLREGVSKEKIIPVGNIMIDSLEMLRPKIERENAAHQYGLTPGEYGVVTLHRPSNVDSPASLQTILHALIRASEKLPMIFPVHPRTMERLSANGLWSVINDARNLRLIEPQSYIPFMNLVLNSKMVVTDSGGLQGETAYLRIPCITLRQNTEWRITIDQGTNRLCRPDEFQEAVDKVIEDDIPKGSIPQMWDGKTAARVVENINKFCSCR